MSDLNQLMGIFTTLTQENNINQTAQSGGGFLNIMSNLFGKK
jgi:hypothetical protein